MSEQDNTIRALQIQCATNGKKLGQLRALNKKLRAELEAVRDKSWEHFQNSQIFSQAMHTEAEVSRAWREAHRQLAEAIGGKAK